MKKYEFAIENLEGKRWIKNDMDRVYINAGYLCDLYYSMPDELKNHGGRLPLNRFERQNGKIWVDVTTDEIKTKNIDCGGDVIATIAQLCAMV